MAPAFLAHYVHQLSPFIVRFGEFRGVPLGLHWYGFAYVLGFLCGYQLYVWLARRGYGPLPADKVGDFIFLAAVFGVMLGGRLGYILFYGWEHYSARPLDAFKTWDGGMASHGGILGLLIFTLVYARWQRLSWVGLGDNLVVVAPVGLFFGRIANFVNGELWGREVPAPAPWWAMQFPKELGEPAQDPLVARAYDHDPAALRQLAEMLPYRYPSQLIEALLEGVVLFVLLWTVRTRVRTPAGVLTGIFFVAYALLRIVGEQFREPDRGVPLTGGLSRGQFLSLFMILIGIGFLIYAYARPRDFTPAAGTAGAARPRSATAAEPARPVATGGSGGSAAAASAGLPGHRGASGGGSADERDRPT